LRIDGASDLDEPHQIPDRNRKVENVFEVPSSIARLNCPTKSSRNGTPMS
jgi:hypothetical protein